MYTLTATWADPEHFEPMDAALETWSELVNAVVRGHGVDRADGWLKSGIEKQMPGDIAGRTASHRLSFSTKVALPKRAPDLGAELISTTPIVVTGG